MALEIRGLSHGELEAFAEAISVPFAFDLPQGGPARAAFLERFGRLLELDRARCAFDDGVMVGTLGVIGLEMTVPGGSLPTAGTTVVTVQPTHRRRGLLRAMMRAHLDEARERGDAMAALWASESSIYGRFGFGWASRELHLDMPTSPRDPHRLAASPAAVRLVPASEAATVLPAIYDRLLPTRPGAYRRSPDWWRLRRLRDDPEDRDGATAYRYAVAEGPDGPAGYAQYRVKQGWADNHGDHEVRVEELVALSPEGWAGLWSFLLSHDLATRLHAPHRPVDEPLVDLLAAPRHAAAPATDALWVRLLDLPASLGGRRYARPGSLVFEVEDPLGIVSGRWRLDADEDGAECRATREEPDITLDAEDLAACSLGWSRFRALARAGRLDGREQALATADGMFSWDPPPWCPEVF